MKSEFIRTKNVKNFITVLNNLNNRAEGVPGMALIYGEPGLGKTQTALWWSANNEDVIYVSAKQSMTTRWLLQNIVIEFDDSPMHRTSELFDQIVKELIRKPKVLIVDEIDYLATDKAAIEILRDIHDRTHTPIVLIGMSLADKKLKRYKHLYDRFSEVLRFELFSNEDINSFIQKLSEVKFSQEAINYIIQTGNRFRQIVKIIDKAEKMVQDNDLLEITTKEIKKII